MHALSTVLARFVRAGNWAAVALAVSVFSGCAVTLVQPYDEKLVNDTEAIFKKASALVDEGISKSPRTDEERAAIRPPSASEAHFAKFEPEYDALLRDADALILRSLARSGEIDAVGSKLQKKIETLIESALPSACPDMDQELKDLSASLTVRNYIDLKCFFVNWKAQHGDMQRTGQTRILKKANWEARKGALFNIVLAIQKAETFKKK